MSALPRFDPALGYAGLRMNADAYLALGETQERYELVDGVIMMSPSPFAIHGRIISRIIFQLELFSSQRRKLACFTEIDLRLSASRVYKPDLTVYFDEKVPKAVRRLTTPPQLIVEILSDSTKAFDLITKRDDYARFGAGEYWVVDPTDGSLRQYAANDDSTFRELTVTGDQVRSTAIEGFVLDLGPVRELAG